MDENRLNQIESELQRLNQRIDNLKSLMLGAQATSPSSTASAAPVNPVAASVSSAQTLNSNPIQAIPAVILEANGTASVQSASSSIGKYASLGVVSVFFFLLAAAYALNLAYQSGYLTPQGILFLLTAVGVGLVGSGYISFTKDKKFQSFLPVTGILILHGVFYSATAVYGMMGPMTALMITLGLSTLGVFLYEEFKYDVYWIISVLGAYFFTQLLKLSPDVVLWNSFLVISSIGFAAASIFVSKRPISLMACVCAFIAVASRQGEYNDFMPVIFMAIHLVVFLAGFVIYFRISKKMLDAAEAIALFAVGVFFFIYSNILAQHVSWQAQMTVAIATIAAFALLRLYVVKMLAPEQKQKSHATEALNSLLFFMVSYAGYVIAVPEEWRPLFVIGMFALTATLLMKQITQAIRLFPMVVAVCLGGMFFLEYGRMLFFEKSATQEITWLWMFIWGMAIIFNEKKLAALESLKTVSQKFWIGYYGLGHILLIKLLWLVTEQYGQTDFRVIYVAFYAGLFVFLGFKLKLKNLAKSALPILVFISALLLLGLGLGSPVVKIFSFLGAGAAFWGAGFLLRKIDRI